ncbi:MAG TPA: hypothetical protein VFN48_03695 [Solirubrobacteraceae bacterium]|nr:hypothetical protein [Solirubrobacteraceae bacterium]
MALEEGDATAGLLGRLDGVLGETARREHRFAWLTDPHSGQWVVVDAYYPRNHVVVITSADPQLRRLCEEQVPAHGLVLLSGAPHALAGAPSDDPTPELLARLHAAGWSPGAPPPAAQTDASGAAPGPGPGAATAPGARTGGPGAGARTRAGASRRGRTGGTPGGVGDVSTGIMLVIVVVLELAVGGGVIGLGAGDPLLGFGFVLDACARVVGAVAASHAGDLDAAWASVVIGSPALWSRDGSASDAAAAAQLTAVIAGVVLALGFIVAVL